MALEHQNVMLEVATSSHARALANMLELYVHDLSRIFEVELGPDGRFGYDKLPLYWSEPGTHFPYLIRVGSHLAGFALATRGSPATREPQVLDVAEFFVLRSYRRRAVGSRAATLMWDLLTGRWVVRVAEANPHGLNFWQSTIQTYTNGRFSAGEHQGKRHAFRVFTFESREPIPAA